jgi:hypothetical protein
MFWHIYKIHLVSKIVVISRLANVLFDLHGTIWFVEASCLFDASWWTAYHKLTQRRLVVHHGKKQYSSFFFVKNKIKRLAGICREETHTGMCRIFAPSLSLYVLQFVCFSCIAHHGANDHVRCQKYVTESKYHSHCNLGGTWLPIRGRLSCGTSQRGGGCACNGSFLREFTIVSK